MKRWWLERRGFYAILDPAHTNGRNVLEVADALLSAPCAVLQLRNKTLPDAACFELASALRGKTRAAQVPLVINDRADIAQLVGADGLHLGQSDLPVTEARRFWGEKCISVSTHNLEQARNAVQSGVDLIALGPIFQTSTKVNPDPVVGMTMLQEICAESSVPVIAIGGIHPNNVVEIYRAGARFAAAISSVTQAEDVTQAARSLTQP